MNDRPEIKLDPVASDGSQDFTQYGEIDDLATATEKTMRWVRLGISIALAVTMLVVLHRLGDQTAPVEPGCVQVAPVVIQEVEQ